MNLSQEDLDQIKKDMLDHYEGDRMQIDVNTVADLVNEVEASRAFKEEPDGNTN